jgi:hypothetical protein
MRERVPAASFTLTSQAPKQSAPRDALQREKHTRKVITEAQDMRDDLTRAQHYRELAQEIENLWRAEQDEKRQLELQSLAQEYDKLADRLISGTIGNHI